MKNILTTLTLGLIVSAQAIAGDDLQSIIHSKAASSKRGVIVALAEPGNDAAETAWLLSQQTQPDTGYVPHLLVLGAEQRKQVSRELRLPDNNTPTLLIYDRKGREIARIVDVRPTQVPWQRKSEAESRVAALANWLQKTEAFIKGAP